ncbi:hypothetical protein SAM19_02730 [Brevibacillus laterosporus]|nr:hypothetical protein [Brevibacillus laterosporus]
MLDIIICLLILASCIYALFKVWGNKKARGIAVILLAITIHMVYKAIKTYLSQ